MYEVTFDVETSDGKPWQGGRSADLSTAIGLARLVMDKPSTSWVMVLDGLRVEWSWQRQHPHVLSTSLAAARACGVIQGRSANGRRGRVG